MLGKLKEVISLSDEIRDLKDSFSKLNAELKEIKNRLDDNATSSKDDRKKESEDLRILVSEISKIKSDMRTISDEYSSELNAFRITKKNIQERLSVEFRDESKKISSDMASHLSAYKDLESSMTKMSQNVDNFNVFLKSLKSLSEEIVKKDFELKNYAKVLDNNDREKVELLKRIDGLEKILSNMKRSSSSRNQPNMTRR